jgi:cysteine desulfurase
MSPFSRLYLDHNASTPIREEAKAAMMAACHLQGNPSSPHEEGRAARSVIENARAHVLTPSFKPSIKSDRRDALLMSAAEHLCLLNGHRFAEMRSIRVTENGLLDNTDLEAALTGTQHPLLALHLAQNETGIVQDVTSAAERVHKQGGLVVCDAVQTPGRMPLSLTALGVDALILSAHKMGGPKGVGALVLASHSLVIEEGLIRGGGQERGWRAGTSNVMGIAGFGAAACEALIEYPTESIRLQHLRDSCEAQLLLDHPDAIIFGKNAPRLPNTTLFALPGLNAETALIQFDLKGIALSSGSACSSGKVKSSHVLDAMGTSLDLARCALRISFGRGNTMQDVERFLAVLAKLRSERKAT